MILDSTDLLTILSHLLRHFVFSYCSLFYYVQVLFNKSCKFFVILKTLINSGYAILLTA